MTYLAMARAYRPDKFSAVIAQAHITDTLQRAIDSRRVASAYLFAGPRGSGKTTVARILAKAVNCDALRGGEPCTVCEPCTSIKDGRSLDVLEIDGASNNSVDDVRELRENVRYAASAPGKRKVYIIDEVHMLSTGAFNALLKTLEEPPPHVLFVFATTEPRKVPQTILSRCQRFDFRRLRSEEIQAQLRSICKQQKLDLEDAALHLLAKRADGSLRDGLSLLDQVTSSLEGKIGEAQVAAILGLVREEVYHELCTAFLARSPVRALELLHAAQLEGADPGGFVVGLVEHLRNLMLLSVDPELRRAVHLGDTYMQRAEALAKSFRSEDLLYLLNRAAALHEEIRQSSQPTVVLEAAMVELARFESRVLLGDVLEQLGAAPPVHPAAPSLPTAPSPAASRKSGARGGGPRSDLGGTPPAAGGPSTPPRARQETPLISPSQSLGAPSQAAILEAGPLALEHVQGRWQSFTQSVSRSKAVLAQCLSEGVPMRLDGGRLHVEFGEAQMFHLEMLQQPEARGELERLLAEYFGMALHIVPSARLGEAAAPPRLTHEDLVQTRRHSVQESVQRAPRLQEILEAFDGEILDEPES